MYDFLWGVHKNFVVSLAVFEIKRHFSEKFLGSFLTPPWAFVSVELAWASEGSYCKLRAKCLPKVYKICTNVDWSNQFSRWKMQLVFGRHRNQWGLKKYVTKHCPHFWRSGNVDTLFPLQLSSGEMTCFLNYTFLYSDQAISDSESNYADEYLEINCEHSKGTLATA
jgi:hypothetical protein